MKSLMASAIAASMTWVSLAEELPEIYYPTRPLGMGGAFTSLANDQNAVWTNPAGIAKTRKPRSQGKINLLSIPNLGVGINPEGRTSFSTLKSSGGQGDSQSVAESIKTAADATGSGNDKPVWANASVAPLAYLASGSYASSVIGFYTNNKIRLFPENDSSGLLQTQLISDTGLVAGFAYGTPLNFLSLGMQVRPMVRYAFDDKIPADQLLDSSQMAKRVSQGANTGSGAGVDAGLIITIPDFWFPSFGLAIFNLPTGCVENYLNPFSEVRQTICGTKFSGTVHNPESLYLIDPTDIRMGFSITPRLSNKFALRLAADLHHLYVGSGDVFYGLPGVEPIKLVHFGLEFFVGNPLLMPPLAFRIGFNQGFITAGFTVRMGFLSIEFASFGEDISSSSTSREDRRLLLSLSAEY